MIDAKLEKAIGLTFVMEKLEPRTPWGREEKARLAPFSPADRDKLSDALDAVEEAGRLEGWRLFDILGRFREIRGTLSFLRGGVLAEAELFELKRFCLNCEALRAALLKQDAPGRFSLPALDGALSVLDPGGTRDPAFSAAQADGALGELLRQKLATPAGTPEFLALQSAEQQALERVLQDLSRALRPEADTFEAAAAAIGALDLALAKAALAARFGGVKPVFRDGALVLTRMVNPALPGFYPLSFRFQRGATVLTGANMGGKSTALFAAALNVRLALTGLYPFAEAAELPLFSDICLIAGDNARSGLSEFGSQAALLAGALKSAEGDVLILIDELARGTNPEEGAAIAAAVAEYLAGKPAVSVLTTHFRGVAERANAHYRARGHMPGEDEAEADYEFRLVEGDLEPPREALRVCSLLGLPEKIIDRAKEFIDNTNDKTVK